MLHKQFLMSPIHFMLFATASYIFLVLNDTNHEKYVRCVKNGYVVKYMYGNIIKLCMLHRCKYCTQVFNNMVSLSTKKNTVSYHLMSISNCILNSLNEMTCYWKTVKYDKYVKITLLAINLLDTFLCKYVGRKDTQYDIFV